MAERNVLMAAQSEFVVKMFSTLENRENLYFVLELCEGGTLRTMLSRVKRMSELQAKYPIKALELSLTTKIRFYVTELALAIKKVHEVGAVYRDLKPSNVALDRSGHVKLIDFGLCKENMDKIGLTSTFCGSIAYLAPEMLKKRGHNRSLDWYLLGVVFYELIVGLPPYYCAKP